MKASVISFCIVVFLAGCLGSIPTNTTTNVPVEVKCVPTTIEKPVTNVNSSAVNLSLFEKLQLALADLELYKGYSTKLEAAATKCTVAK